MLILVQLDFYNLGLLYFLKENGFFFKLLDVLFIMHINVKMLTVVGLQHL